MYITETVINNPVTYTSTSSFPRPTWQQTIESPQQNEDIFCNICGNNRRPSTTKLLARFLRMKIPLRMMGFSHVTSLGQRKNSESPQGTEPNYKID